MKAWHPGHKEIVRFLRIVTSPRRIPVLVHCQHGADRTGTMTARLHSCTGIFSNEYLDTIITVRISYNQSLISTDSCLTNFCDIFQRRCAKQAAVFAAELGRALVPDLKCCGCGILIFNEH